MNLAIDKIPTDAPSFRKWADAACPQWPGELQVLAYRAWQWLDGMKFRSAADHEAFMAGYKNHIGISNKGEVT